MSQVSKESKGKIVSIKRNGDVVVTRVEVTKLLSEPLAPAALYEPENQEAIQFHKLLKAHGNILDYETYEYKGLLPKIGTLFIYRVWWTPAQLKAVKDTSREWTYEEYPDDGDHDHCLLTWETIATSSDCKRGYRSGRDWITEKAYKRYIVDDILRVRGNSTI